MNTNEIQNVFWLQSASSLDADLFLINGEPPISKDKETKTFLWMTSNWETTPSIKGLSIKELSIKDLLQAKWKLPKGWKRHKEQYLPLGISNNLTYLENGAFLLIQACVLDTDEQGRKRPYMCCLRYPESNSMREIFENWAACIHSAQARHNEKDVDCVKSYLKKRAEQKAKNDKKKRIISIAIVLIVILIIVASILLYNFNPDYFYSLYEKFR